MVELAVRNGAGGNAAKHAPPSKYNWLERYLGYLEATQTGYNPTDPTGRGNSGGQYLKGASRVANKTVKGAANALTKGEKSALGFIDWIEKYWWVALGALFVLMLAVARR